MKEKAGKQKEQSFTKQQLNNGLPEVNSFSSGLWDPDDCITKDDLTWDNNFSFNGLSDQTLIMKRPMTVSVKSILGKKNSFVTVLFVILNQNALFNRYLYGKIKREKTSTKHLIYLQVILRVTVFTEKDDNLKINFARLLKINFSGRLDIGIDRQQDNVCHVISLVWMLTNPCVTN